MGKETQCVKCKKELYTNDILCDKCGKYIITLFTEVLESIKQYIKNKK